MNTSTTVLPRIPNPATSFTLLSEHQAQTPTTFFGAKPVLHAEFRDADLLVGGQDVRSWGSSFLDVLGAVGVNGEGGAAIVDGDSVRRHVAAEEEQEEVEDDDDDGGEIRRKNVYSGVSGYITSESVILFRSSGSPSSVPASTSKALSIPYPAISLHAIQRLYTFQPHTYTSSPTPHAGLANGDSRGPGGATETQALYLQIDIGNPATRDPSADEDAAETVEVLIVPQAPSSGEQATPAATRTSDPLTSAVDRPTVASITISPTTHLFEALSHCADLHPDPTISDDGDHEGGSGGGGGGLAALLAGGGMPGAGGWITAENMHEFEGRFDGHGDDEEGDDGEEGLEAGLTWHGGEEGGEDRAQMSLGPDRATRLLQ